MVHGEVTTGEKEHSPRLFEGEKALIWVGILGILLGLICSVYIWLNGPMIPPEGDLTKARSFNLAIGIFIISTAAFLPLTTMKQRSRFVVRWLMILFSLYGYGIETIQHFRGLDPRFSMHGQLVDLILGAVFGLLAVVVIILYVYIAYYFFNKKSMSARPLITLSMRYGMVTTMMGLFAGIWISILQSRYTGHSGNIIWLHGFALHGLQTIPIIGLLLEKLVIEHKKRLIHISGWAWTGVISMIGVQTILGKSIAEFTLVMLGCYIFLAIWAIIFFKVFSSFIFNWKKGLSPSKDSSVA